MRYIGKVRFFTRCQSNTFGHYLFKLSQASSSQLFPQPSSFFSCLLPPKSIKSSPSIFPLSEDPTLVEAFFGFTSLFGDFSGDVSPDQPPSSPQPLPQSSESFLPQSLSALPSSPKPPKLSFCPPEL